MNLASEVAIDPDVHVQHEEMAGAHRINPDVAKQVHREVFRERVCGWKAVKNHRESLGEVHSQVLIDHRLYFAFFAIENDDAQSTNNKQSHKDSPRPTLCEVGKIKKTMRPIFE